MKRERTCEGCGVKFSAGQKKALEKHKYCSHKCYLSSKSSKEMAAMAKKAATHGMYKSRIYRIWNAMRQRCSNPNTYAYKSYGAKGISYPESWDKFENFHSDMKDGYKDHLTLDRIDGTKSYSKENCRWATQEQQTHNTRTNVNVDCDGEVMCAAACARKMGVHRSTILAWVYKGKLKRV